MQSTLETPQETRTIDRRLSPKQTLAFDTLEDPKVEELLYGGAKYGGKSVFGCIWSYFYCKYIIKLCKLKPREYPIPVGFMGRKQGTDFMDTTFETWKRFIPFDLYKVHEQKKEIVIEDTVKINFGGLDDQLNINKFNSAEYAFAFVDQAEEITRDDAGMIRGTLRLEIDGIKIPTKALWTANPAICWLKDDFILSPIPVRRFVQALPIDNVFVDGRAYVERLKEAFRHRPELVQALVFGSWDQLEGSNILISHMDAQFAVNLEVPTTKAIKRLIVCDPSRFGDDETVVYAFQNTSVIDQEIFGKKDTFETAGRLLAMRNKHQATLIVVDEIGIGAGVVDALVKLKGRNRTWGVYPFNSASKPKDEIMFINTRAEAWWYASGLFNDQKVSIPPDPILVGQLAASTYKYGRGGRVQIEDKEDIKKRLNRSPDRADAIVMGLYALQDTPVWRPYVEDYRGLRNNGPKRRPYPNE